MAQTINLARKVYRAVVPRAIRESAVVVKAVDRIKPHNAIYDQGYYEMDVEPAAARSASGIAKSIARDFHPARVLDVGCGTGAALEALRDLGCHVHGLEYSAAALEYCRRRGLDVQRFNIEKDEFTPVQRFDLVLSTEVAEHLPEASADRYVDLLTRAAPLVVFSAAPPGQEGSDHVNLQLPAYWQTKFAARGFEHDGPCSAKWQTEWKDGDVEDFYYRNLMVFRQLAV